jgi:hypothetical protein
MLIFESPMKKYLILLFIPLSVGSLIGCHSDALLVPELPEYFVINGDTMRVRDDRKSIDILDKSYTTLFHGGLAVVGDTVLPYRKMVLPDIGKKPDLTGLRSPSNEGKPFRMISLANETGLGIRDFGLFNEGMETAYPNLVAHQMGIEYNLPLFDKDDFNGFQRIVRTSFNPTGGPAIKLKRVVNNLGIENIKKINNYDYEVKLKPLKEGVDSYYSATDADTRDFQRSQDPWWSLGAELKKSKGFDFFILETRLNQFGDRISLHTAADLEKRDWERYPEDGFAVRQGTPGAGAYLTNIQDNLVRWFKDHKVTKGVIVNIKYPETVLLSKNYREDLVKLMERYSLEGLYSTDGSSIMDIPTYSYQQIKNGNYWVGGTNSTMDSLLSPKVNINLKPGINSKNKAGKGLLIVKMSEIENSIKIQREQIDKFNQSLKVYSDYLNVPVFDLNGVYKKVHEGRYVTHDGIRVTVDYENGNFYSTDSNFLSAFGQAIIANELIKTINVFYKTDIPLIQTRGFLK